MARRKVGPGYRSVFNASDMITADVVCQANTWNQIGTLTVPRGHVYALGYGTLVGQDSASGRIYADLNSDAPGDYNGDVRFELRNSRDETVQTLFECRTEQLRTSATDRTQQLPFPVIPVRAGEDWILAMMFRPAVADTLVAATAVMLMDITVWPLID